MNANGSEEPAPAFSRPELNRPELSRPELIRQIGGPAGHLHALVDQVGSALELAAHLEALGVNNHRARDEYGHRTTFELAAALYGGERDTPPRVTLPARPPAVNGFPSAAWSAATLLLLLVTGVTHAFSWPVTVFLMVWSQVGSAAHWLARSRDETCGRQADTAALGIGVVSALLISPAQPAMTVIALAWVVCSSLNTAGQPRLSVIAALAVSPLMTGLPPLACLPLLVAAALPLRSTLARPGFGWLRVSASALLDYAVYGAAQGALLYGAVGRASMSASLIGAVLAEGLLVSLVLPQARSALRGCIWQLAPGPELARGVRHLTVRVSGWALLLPACALLWSALLPHGTNPALLEVTMLSSLLTLSLWALDTCGRRLPVLLSLGAALLVTAHLPYLVVVGTFSLLLLAAALLRAGAAHAYAGAFA